MTNDFKNNILEWLSGTFQVTSGEEMDTFQDNYSVNSNIYENYDTNAIIKCTKQVVSPKNIGVMWTILVLWSDTLHKGRFVILNENSSIVATIDEYSSGATIGCYYGIEVDEKGRLYGIEWFNQERVRFIILNNIAVPLGTEYYADIRKTYNVPSFTHNNQTINPIQNKDAVSQIVKVQDEAKYGFDIQKDYGDDLYYTFQIDIDNGNIWKSGYMTNGLWKATKLSITYDNNLFTFKKLIFDEEENTSGMYSVYNEHENNITGVYTTLFTDTNGNIPLTSDILWLGSKILVPFVSTDKTKFVLQTIEPAIDSSSLTFTKVYEENMTTNECICKFADCNTYSFMYVVGRNTDIVQGDIGFKKSVYRLLVNNDNFTGTDLEEKIIYETSESYPYWLNTEYFLVQNQYNLYNYLIGDKTTDLTSNQLKVVCQQEIYNENNYNGSPCKDVGSIEGKQFILKNGTKILFASDTYDISKYQNITNYTCRIANNLLNNVDIEKTLLWSYSKNIMNEETSTIVKNIYEELMIVIHNKLNIIDNNGDTPVYNYEGAEYFNTQMESSLEIVNVPIYKYRINYTDNTTSIKSLTSTKVGNKAVLSFTLTIDKEISSINFINNDENISYCTITPTLEIGKTYTIKQDIRIGD